MDSSEPTARNSVAKGDILPIESCTGEQYLDGLTEGKKNRLLAKGLRRCVNVDNAEISGGTEDGMTERLVIIEW